MASRKLSDFQYARIRDLARKGVAHFSIGRLFSIQPTTVRWIVDENFRLAQRVRSREWTRKNKDAINAKRRFRKMAKRLFL